MPERPVARPATMSGNGAIIDIGRGENGWTVTFAAEPRTSPQPLWFNIEVEGIDGETMHFVWENPDTTLGPSSELDQIRPVLRCDDGEWSRCDAVEVARLPDGRARLHFSADAPRGTVQAAFCYPYAPPNLEQTLRETGDAWERSVIGVTGQGRPLWRLRSKRGSEEDNRPGLYLLARQHAGETPGSWVLDGILRFLAEDPDGFAEQLDCWAAPFVDLDGVIAGDYGKDALPQDFNRSWEALPMRPEVHAIMADFRRFAPCASPRLALDLHAPGHATPGIYVQLPREQRPREHRVLAESFAQTLAPLFPELDGETIARPTTYPSRWNALATVGSWVWDSIGTLLATVETSYQRIGDRPLTPEGYRDAGRRVVRAAWSWLQHHGS